MLLERKIKSVFQCFCLVVLLFWWQLALPDSSHDRINMLTWWGYFDNPAVVKSIEKQCSVKVSFDDYYSNQEFLRRLNSSVSSYDIAIFSSTIYNLVKDKVSLKSSPLHLVTKNYLPAIRKYYVNGGYAPNVVFFNHSVSGFLWNPKVVNLTEKDSIAEIFKKASGKKVNVIDDPVEVWNILNLGLNDGSFVWDDSGAKNIYPLTLKRFRELTNKNEVFVENDFRNILLDKDFALSFSWSGDAILAMFFSEGRGFRFLVHPKLSYITSDLLAARSNDSKVLCVANFLSSKQFLSKINRSLNYLSPYGLDDGNQNKYYREVYEKVLSNMDKFSWVKPIKNEDFKALLSAWYNIKFELIK